MIEHTSLRTQDWWRVGLEGGLTANDDDLAKESRVLTGSNHGLGLSYRILQHDDNRGDGVRKGRGEGKKDRLTGRSGIEESIV